MEFDTLKKSIDNKIDHKILTCLERFKKELMEEVIETV